MIFQQINQPCRQNDYGLEIPLLSTRPERIMAALAQQDAVRRKLPQWLQLVEPDPIAWSELARVHDGAFLARLQNPTTAAEEVIKAYELRTANGAWHRYNPNNARLPLSDLVTLQRREAQTSILAAERALQTGFAYHLGGGMHHAMPDCGRGFCIVNDVAVLASRQIEVHGADNVWIVDVDAHKGDGTACIFADHAKVHTLSIHMAQGWPLAEVDDERSLIPSDIDIAIAAGEEAQYNVKLATGMQQLQAKYPDPDLIIVVDGSDPYSEDSLPSASLLQLSLPQLLARDQLIYKMAQHLAVPQVWLMAGGYGDEVYKVHAQFLAWVIGEGDR